MSTKTVQPANVEVLPFFARFLEQEVTEVSDTAPASTRKYPSDWEEY